MQQLSKVKQWLAGLTPGIEIGAFKTPIPGIRPIYIDKYATYANAPCLADYQGEAIALPFKTNSLGYVASSHVLEHVANPVRALVEWYRVLRPGGLIYLVVPDRRYTWDHPRAPTTVEHMIADYIEKKTPVDGTHIDDFVENIDWSRYSPTTSAEGRPKAKQDLRQLYWATVNSGSEINIHFHVFEPNNLRGLIEALKWHPDLRLKWKLVDLEEQFPEENPIGILAVIRVRKSFNDRIQAVFHRLRRLAFRESDLLPTAQRFN